MKSQPVLFSLFVAAVTLTIALPAVAADSPSPDRHERAMQQAREMFTPLSGQTARIMMETQLEVLAHPETAAKLAAFSRNYYKALVKEGFTEAQAFELVKSIGRPLVPMTGATTQ